MLFINNTKYRGKVIIFVHLAPHRCMQLNHELSVYVARPGILAGAVRCPQLTARSISAPGHIGIFRLPFRGYREFSGIQMKWRLVYLFFANSKTYFLLPLYAKFCFPLWFRDCIVCANEGRPFLDSQMYKNISCCLVLMVLTDILPLLWIVELVMRSSLWIVPFTISGFRDWHLWKKLFSVLPAGYCTA